MMRALALVRRGRPSGFWLVVLATSGCEQLLEVDAYQERSSNTSSSTGGGEAPGEGGAGGGGSTTASTTGATTSTGMTNECYDERALIHLSEDLVVEGHQGLCTETQLGEISDCWLSNDFNCVSFFSAPANADCRDCVRGTPAATIVPAQLTAFGLQYYYTQVIACEAVSEGKEDQCLGAVQMEFCRVTACEACYGDDADYYECQDYAVAHGCSDIVVPPECESLFINQAAECYGPTIQIRSVKAATVLCGP
ncbi:MAG: hypothetical protein HOV80_32180 [Polyangiaceae bacterium]|nr:hypothetical protein [Polyangiaceae bacterium]